MAWAKIDQSLIGHRKTLRLARMMQVSVHEAVGILCCLWLWGIDNADPSGLLAGVEAADLADALRIHDAEQLAEALITSGYLDKTEEGYVIHNWPEYGGALQRNRENDRIRKRESRSREAEAKESSTGNKDVRRMSSGRDEDVQRMSGAREEKSRVEKSNNISPYNPPNGGARASIKNDFVGFEEFWSLWPKKQGKQDAEKAWNKIKPDASLFDTIRTAIEQQKHSQQWTKDSGQYIPLPATWLNAKRWEDELPHAQDAPPRLPSYYTQTL